MADDPYVFPEAGCTEQFGALCWRMRRDRVEVLLITSRDTGRWVVPKGWAIKGLSPAETAAREAWEEAGVEGMVDEATLGSFRYKKVLRAPKFIPCEVQVFGLRVAGLAPKFPERKERRRKWFVTEEAARQVAEPELRQLLKDLPQALGKAEPAAGLVVG
jgi:8-oxo-dGTP pyrophosphatase MutT (NUDIX family)